MSPEVREVHAALLERAGGRKLADAVAEDPETRGLARALRDRLIVEGR